MRCGNIIVPISATSGKLSLRYPMAVVAGEEEAAAGAVVEAVRHGGKSPGKSRVKNRGEAVVEAAAGRRRRGGSGITSRRKSRSIQKSTTSYGSG